MLMPSYIVKASPDEDFYVVWSTVVDAPCAFGTRAELEKSHPDEAGRQRFGRADERGTSANWPDWPADRMPFGWQAEIFVVMEGSPDRDDEDGWWTLPRVNLRAYCEAVGRGEAGAEFLIWEAVEDASH